MRTHAAKARGLLLCVVCAATCAGGGTHDAELAPFEITYDIQLAGLGAGKGTVQLKPNGNRLLYITTVTPRGLLSTLFGDTLKIRTHIHLEEGRIVAEEYIKEYTRKADRKQRYRFEAHGRSVEILKKGRVYFLPVPAGTLDEASVQLQLSRDVAARDGPWHYAVVSNGKLRHYRFAETGVETITTTLGKIETVRVERTKVRDTGNHTIDHRYWLSPAHRHLPVKVERIEDGRVKRTMVATTIILETPR